MSSPKLCFLTLLALLILFSYNFNFTTSQTSKDLCNPNDKQVLLNIKHYLGNPFSLSTWDPNNECGGPIGRWSFVGTNKMGRVTSLGFFLTEDIYTIPPFMDQLPALTSLSFFKMYNLSGPIPPYIANLTNLTSFRISYTDLRGPIPSVFGHLTKLETLDLSYNILSGPIPDFIDRLTNLTKLNLSCTNLNGPITATLSKLTKLSMLSLDLNNLSGQIPKFLCQQLVKLTTLDLSSNNLSGAIPESLGLCTSVYGMVLSDNRLEGTVPKSLAKFGTRVLMLSGNQLTGDSSFLFDKNSQNDIEYIDISNNFFYFNFTNVELSPKLIAFNISRNMIYGKLPKLFYRLLKDMNGDVDVSYNYLCGPIPNGRRLKQVKPIIFAHNKCLCGGPLPPCK